MRTSLYLVGFAAASIVAGGLFEIGCSSSSSAAPAGSAEASTDDGGAEAGSTPCTPAFGTTNAATFNSGSATWTCLQAACATSLAACGADCACNNALLGALSCQTDGGAVTTCFTPVFSAGMAGSGAISCLMSKTAGCGVSLDGGTDGATNDGATNDGATHDGATNDGGDAAAP